MTIRFKSNRLAKQLGGPLDIKKHFGINAKRVNQRMTEMQNAPNLEVLLQIPAANCHALTSDRAGEWAVDISACHRLIFEIDQDPIPSNDDGSVKTILVTNILILETTNYH